MAPWQPSSLNLRKGTLHRLDWKLTARNLGPLVWLIIATCSASTSVSAAPSTGNVDGSRIENPTAEPDQWLLSGRDWRGTYHSPLAQINDKNARSLGFAWQHALATTRGLEATAIIVDGWMFLTSSFGRVYALDAATGRQIWGYDPHSDGQWARYACCDAVNRGLAVWLGRVRPLPLTAGCMRSMPRRAN